MQHSPTTRNQQALKINAILDDFLGTRIKHLTCLDIGCGTGEISLSVAENVGKMVATDITIDRFPKSREPQPGQKTFFFSAADGSALPFDDQSFDLVICTQVYEHTADQHGLAGEIWRVLKPGGVCFWSGPNRFAVMEEHYFLPFLSWLPQPAADRYVRLFHRGVRYDILPLSYGQLRRLLKRFQMFDANIKILKNPERYGMADRYRSLRLFRKFPDWLLARLLWWVPNFNWILIK